MGDTILIAPINRAHLGAIAAVAALIALVARFDVLFEVLVGGNAMQSIALITVLVLSGAWFASQCGMRLELSGPGRPVLTALAAAAAVAVYILLLDCWLFRSQIDPRFVTFLHKPLGDRLLYFMPRAFNENVIYRLFGFSLLLWLVQRIRGGKPAESIVLLGAMIASQLVNIGFNLAALAPHRPDAAVLLYDLLRYIVPGVAWAILFRRNGFACAEIASVGCHLILQPGFSLLL